MTGRISRDAYGLKLAEAAALRADCTRRQVGAVVIAPDGSVVSTGYNGLASGLPGCASAGACPRGQMAYPTPAPLAVGDPDTLSPYDGPDYRSCGAEDPDGWLCTLGQHDTPWHVASHGPESPVLAVWPAVGTQEASVGYEATGCRAVHAEVNAILRGRGREGCKGATIYVTDVPCFHCSVVIEGAGIVRVVTPTTEDEQQVWRAADRQVVDETGIRVYRGDDLIVRMGTAEDFAPVLNEPLQRAHDRLQEVAARMPSGKWTEDAPRTSGPLDPEVYAALKRQEERRSGLSDEDRKWLIP